MCLLILEAGVLTLTEFKSWYRSIQRIAKPSNDLHKNVLCSFLSLKASLYLAYWMSLKVAVKKTKFNILVGERFIVSAIARN